MAIKLKAKETLQRIGDYKDQYRYVLSTEIYNRLSEEKVIKEAAIQSGVSRGVMQAQLFGEKNGMWVLQNGCVGAALSRIMRKERARHGNFSTRRLTFSSFFS